MLRLFIVIILGQFLNSCSGFVGGDYEENLEKFDKVYGYCDNPHRALRKSSIAYKNCKRKEMAAGADGIVDDDATNPFAGLLNRGGQNSGAIVMANVNKDLWIGSLETLNDYSLKIADSMGGYIETDWINQKEAPNNRCLIKVRITSQELISNGVATKFICEEKINNQWVANNDSYVEEEKQLTLKILSTAAALSENTL